MLPLVVAVPAVDEAAAGAGETKVAHSWTTLDAESAPARIACDVESASSAGVRGVAGGICRGRLGFRLGVTIVGFVEPTMSRSLAAGVDKAVEGAAAAPTGFRLEAGLTGEGILVGES